jgi:hypothetical protein
VWLYPIRNRVGDRVYVQYTLVDYQGGKQLRREFFGLAEAKAEGELVAVKLASGEGEALKLSGVDRAVYLHAMQTLRPLGISLSTAPLGSPLDAAVSATGESQGRCLGIPIAGTVCSTRELAAESSLATSRPLGRGRWFPFAFGVRGRILMLYEVIHEELASHGGGRFDRL